jgi:hypothetical protein
MSVDPQLLGLLLAKRNREENLARQKQETEQKQALGLMTALAQIGEDVGPAARLFENRGGSRDVSDVIGGIGKITRERKKKQELAAKQAEEAGLVRSNLSEQLQSAAGLLSNARAGVPGAQHGLNQVVSGALQRTQGLPEERARFLQNLQLRAPIEGARSRGELPEQLAQFQVGTEFERNLQFFPSRERERLRQARARLLALGQPQTSTQVTLTGNQILQEQENMDTLVGNVSLVNQMRTLIMQDRTRAGFASRIRNAIDRGEGVIAAFAEVVPGFGPFMTDMRSRLEQELLTEMSDPNNPNIEQLNDFQRIIFDPSIGELELLETLLAFGIERTLTGGRRFSIQAVQDIRKQINIKDARGPEAVVRRLDVAERLLKASLTKQERRVNRLTKLVEGGKLEENLGAFGSSETFIIDEKGNLSRGNP